MNRKGECFMNFYYYSNEPLDFVKSLRKLGGLSQSDIDVALKQAMLTDAIGSRTDAIQLFVYPQGKEKLVGGVIVDDSKPIYENEVAIEKLPVNVLWVLRDTTEYMSEKIKHTTDGGDLAVDAHMNNWVQKNGHYGRGIAGLQKAIKKYTTNFIGKPNSKYTPVIEIYPYVGYVRVSKSAMKSF